jgi:hypothetical protein
MAGVSVGDLYVSLTSSGTALVEKELQQVDRAAESTAQAMTQVEQAVQRTGTASTVTARSLAESWGVFDQGAQAQRKATDAAEQHTTVVTRQERAQRQSTKATDEHTKATGGAVSGTTRLTSSMDRLATVAGTVSPELGNMAAALSTVSAGGVLVGGIVAGVTALVAVYDLFTKQAREAKEEQEKLTKSLEEWYRVKALGPGGARQQEVGAEQKKLIALEKDLLKARQAASAALTDASAARAGTTGQLVAARNQRVRELEEQVAQVKRVIAAGSRDVIQTRTKAFIDELTLEIGQLRELDKLGQLKVAQREKLTQLEAQAVALRDQLNDPATRTTGITEQQRQELVLRLTKAVTDEKTKQAKATKAQKDGTDALVSALGALADAHDLTYGDIQRAQELYDAEAKALNDNTTSIERRAKALQRMKTLEKAGAVGSGPMSTTADPQAPGFTPEDVDAFVAGSATSFENLRGMDKIGAAFGQSIKDSIVAANLGIYISEGMNEAIADANVSTVAQGIGNLANQFASFTTDAFSVALSAVSAGLQGGWDQFGKVLLGGLGSILQSMGAQLMTTGAALMGLLPALSNPFTSGPAMLAAGALIFGAGAALSAIAGGGGGGGGGRSAPASGGIGGLGIGGPAAPNPFAFAAGSRVNGMTFGQRTAEPRTPVTVNATIIGPNDINAQRAIKQLLSNAERRGIS